MDFSTITDSIPIPYSVGNEVVHTELRPGFDSAHRLFFVQLWEDGRLLAVHGRTDNFRHAEEPLEAIDAFLADHGVPAVTDEEAVRVYAGLVQAEGGEGWRLMQLLTALRDQA
ncbi:MULTISPECIES: hypothetical protein [Streptomyces]|uniref:hypothetical protein n=1 Tax=Streptomyces TaxID=1883 RepID=UPI001361E857|nr:hypothetical protein [Streptomyces sp. SID724]